MKKILIHVKNSLLLQSIQLALKKTNNFIVDMEVNDEPDAVLERLMKKQYDILFLDVARSYPYTFEEREKMIYIIKKQNIKTGIVVFCDSNSEPEMANKVKELKALKYIEAFFYETVDGKYMADVLETL